MTKTKQFLIYLLIAVPLLFVWGTVNYSNYMEAEAQKQELLQENVALIDESLEEVEVEQEQYKGVQRALNPARTRARSPAAATPPPMAEVLPAAPESRPEDRVMNELEDRIAHLEREKIALKNDRNYVTETITAMFNIFTKVDVKNPILNLFIVPLLVYFFKKCIDLGFDILRKRYKVA